MSLKEQFERGKSPQTVEDTTIANILSQLEPFRPETRQLILQEVSRVVGLTKPTVPAPSNGQWGDH